VTLLGSEDDEPGDPGNEVELFFTWSKPTTDGIWPKLARFQGRAESRMSSGGQPGYRATQTDFRGYPNEGASKAGGLYVISGSVVFDLSVNSTIPPQHRLPGEYVARWESLTILMSNGDTCQLHADDVQRTLVAARAGHERLSVTTPVPPCGHFTTSIEGTGGQLFVVLKVVSSHPLDRWDGEFYVWGDRMPRRTFWFRHTIGGAPLIAPYEFEYRFPIASAQRPDVIHAQLGASTVRTFPRLFIPGDSAPVCPLPAVSSPASFLFGPFADQSRTGRIALTRR
jgi:hypothetical protein